MSRILVISVSLLVLGGFITSTYLSNKIQTSNNLQVANNQDTLYAADDLKTLGLVIEFRQILNESNQRIEDLENVLKGN
jgi:hypothetical protein